MITDRPFFNSVPQSQAHRPDHQPGRLPVRQPADVLQPARLARTGHRIQLHLEQVFRRELLQPRRHRRLSPVAESAEHRGQSRPLRSRCPSELQRERRVLVPDHSASGRTSRQGMATQHDLHRHQRTAFQRAAGRRRRSFGPGSVRQFHPGGMGRNSGQLQHPESGAVRGGERHSRRTVGVFDPCGRQNFDDTAANFLSGDIPLSPFYIPCPGTVGNFPPQSADRSRPQPNGT